VGGAVRAEVRLLAGVGGRGGCAVSRLRHLGQWLCPCALPEVSAGVPGGLLVQGARVMPVVRGQAGGGAGGVPRGRGRGGRGPRPVGVHHPEDAAGVLPLSPGAAGRVVASGGGDGERAPGGGGHGGEGLSPRSGRCGSNLRGPGQLPPSCPRAGDAGRLDGGRTVDTGAVCGRAGGRGAVPPQGAGAASAPGAAEPGADRAADVVASQRLLRAQPGVRPPPRGARVRGPGTVHNALAGEPVPAALHPRREGGRLRPKGRT
jgi:hypothetical protein